MSREAMQAGLDALKMGRIFLISREKIKQPEGIDIYDAAIARLEAALAAPVGDSATTGRSPKYSGGPAFPGEMAQRFGQPNDCNEGMTLRDYFAAAALTGLVAGDDRTFRESARAAYIVADAMLAERAKAVP